MFLLSSVFFFFFQRMACERQPVISRQFKTGRRTVQKQEEMEFLP
jgi:hypothetical protein